MHFVRRLTARSVFALAFFLASCGGGDGGGDGGGAGPDPSTQVGSVLVDPTAGVMDVGTVVQFEAIVKSQTGLTMNRSVSWSSSNTSVATINSAGSVSGISAGVSTITASAGGVSGTGTITVSDPNPPAAPSGLTATPASNTAIDLSWADNSNNETGFIIERETGGASGVSGAASGAFTEIARPNANSRSLRDTGLSGGTIYRYRIRATNGAGDSGLSSTVETATFGTLAITTASLPDGTLGATYSAQLASTGGNGTPTWTVTLGSLPDGLSLSTAGAVTGTPTVEGTFNFTISAEGGGQQVFANFSVTIGAQTLPPLVPDVTLPTANVGVAYTQTLTATRGDGSYSWSQNGGSLPPGIGLTFGGVVLGTPTQAGTFTFGAQALSAGLTGVGQITITVIDVLQITTVALPGATVGGAYSATLTATGGNGTYTWTGTGLPAGITLSSAGVLSGTPTTAGSNSLVLTVTSGDGQTAQVTLPLVVSNGLSITTTSLSNGQVGVAYSAALAATGGTGSITWALAGGSLPTGLALSGAGAITGTPTTAGAGTFTVRATSGDGQTATKSLTITIAAGAVTVTTSTLAGGTVGAAYSATLAASGGNGSYTWSLTSGSLPAGLSLSTGGVISGTPTTAATSNFTVQASSGGQTGSASLSITIAAAPMGGAFNIEIVYGGVVSGADQAVFEQAAQKWERVITSDLADWPAAQNLPAACGHPTFTGGVDDVKIYVTVDSIDGAFNTLAQAGACYIRVGGTSPGKPITGVMSFDSADMQWLRDNNALINTVLHEMGHVLGIGAASAWEALITGTCLADVRWTGALAVAAWNGIGGAGNVPVENLGAIDDGSNCSHWREATLDAELMTPSLDAGVANPLSLITVQSLADIGYSVDTGEAESFSLAPPAPAALRRAPREKIHLVNDFFLPRFGITQDGVITILSPGARR